MEMEPKHCSWSKDAIALACVSPLPLPLLRAVYSLASGTTFPTEAWIARQWTGEVVRTVTKPVVTFANSSPGWKSLDL